MATTKTKRKTKPWRQARRLRKQQHLGLREAARMADIDPSNLSRWESTGRGLGVDALKRLAPVLGVSAAKLLGLD